MHIDKNHIVYDIKRYSPLVYDMMPDIKPGTIRYDDFWDAQDHRMLNGYKPEGMPKIQKYHYYYLNVSKIYMLPEGRKKKSYYHPSYRALDRRISEEVLLAEKEGHGLIFAKPRQIGMSWYGAMLADHELTMYKDSFVGVAAGVQSKATDFYKKVKAFNKYKRKEYRHGVITENDETLLYGYKDIVNKQTILKGIHSEMTIQTMYSDPGAFEGKNFNKVIFEEIGLFQKLIAAYRATEPAFKSGALMFGIPLLWGTAGNIDGKSKDYKTMWQASSFTNPKKTAYMLKKVLILADEYFPGEGSVDEKTGKVLQFFDHKTGETNKKLAREFILEMYDRTRNDAEGYIKVMQSYPLKESHLFQKSTGGILDRIKLNSQLAKKVEGDIPYQIKRGHLEWVDDPSISGLLSKAKNAKEKAKIRIAKGSKVKFIRDENYGLIYKLAEPINKEGMQFKPDIGGVDSYDEEVDLETKHSLGATVIYRLFHGAGRDYDLPVGYLAERGDSSNDDTFYENSLKMAVYWNTPLLIEYSKIAIINYFEDVGAQEYLKERPILLDLNSKAKNTYGQQMKKQEKILVTRLLKAEIRDNYYKYWFDDMILDLIDYGDTNTDIAMALGMCLMWKLELFQDLTDDLDDEYMDDELDAMSYYYVDEYGDLQMEHFGEKHNENYIETFNPEKDLTGIQYEEYKKQINKTKEEKEMQDRKIEELENKYGKNKLEWLIKEEIEKNRNK